jgi:hypothetical protein
MATVDPDDDSIRRFIALHYRYDPTRHERRSVVVAAFDNEKEFQSFLDDRNAELLALQASGEAEAGEHVSGVVHEVGYRRKQQNARVLKRAVEHGVWPTQIDEQDLSANVGVLRAGRLPRKVGTWRRVLLEVPRRLCRYFERK